MKASRSVWWLFLCAALAQAAEPLQVLPPTPADEGVWLEWRGGDPGRAYTVQTRDTLRGGLWVAAPADTPWPLLTNRWLDPRPADRPRFYRVLAVEPAERGKVLSVSDFGIYGAAQLNFMFRLAGIPVTATNDVAAYKLVYETVDPWGGRAQASGFIAIPQVTGRSWPLASYQHGTLAKKSEAPSANALGERLVGLAFAASGYLGVLPDYLGLGDSPGVPAYHHARAEGTAGVDMLRAGRAFCASRGVALDGQLFLIGYSHGGHATMALLRELETFHADEFTVTAAAPMAGAYDLSGVTTEDFLSPRPKPNPYYSALLLAALQDIYRLAPSLGDLLAPPYNQTLPPLLTGQNTGAEINAAMPADPRQVLRPEYLAAFTADPDHALRHALRDNDVFRWTPRSPLRLYHCAGDQDVPFANSQVAFEAFQAAGASQVQLLDLNPNADHGGCTLPSLLAAKVWFDSLRQ
jgi:hypothetical protein